SRGNGFFEILKQNYKKRLLATRIVVRDYSTSSEGLQIEASGATIHDQIDSVLKCVPADAYIPLTTTLINSFIFEVATNAPKYALDVSLIEFEISRDYLSVSVHTRPKPDTVTQLVGSANGFRQYYRVRRGFGMERTTSPGYAIGLALQALLGPHFKV